MSILITKEFITDLNREPQRLELADRIYQEDKQAHKIVVTVKHGDTTDALTGAGVTANFIRADGATVTITGAVEDGKAAVTLPESCYTVPGYAVLIIRATIGDVRQVILWADTTVTVSTTDVIIDPGHTIPSLAELLAKIAAAEAAAEAASEAAEGANTAAETATAAAGEASTAAWTATAAAGTANAAALKIDGMTAEANGVPYGTPATATVTEQGGHKHISFDIPAGEPGQGMTILGVYPTLAALQAAVTNPNQGDFYQVGTAAPYIMYMWDAGSNAWLNEGSLGAGVTSVNGQTGAVTLTANNIVYTGTQTVKNAIDAASTAAAAAGTAASTAQSTADAAGSAASEAQTAADNAADAAAAAQETADVKAERGLFTGTLTAAGWVNGVQTIAAMTHVTGTIETFQTADRPTLAVDTAQVPAGSEAAVLTAFGKIFKAATGTGTALTVTLIAAADVPAVNIPVILEVIR